MIYKTLKKVSDVCQLLDKSKYPATKTDSGITFTNNGDGTITVNGTCTNQYYSGIYLNIETDKMNPGHIYFNTAGGSLLLEYSGGYLMKANNTIFTLPEYEYIQTRVAIRISSGVTVSDMILKPQLFDLTEMYGAGNEPTTVEQFRQDFPEEMYDYKPYCFVKSYKSIMICKTKNLFPTSTSVGTLSGWNQSTARQFEEDKWYIGITANNYYEPSTIIEYELTGNYVYINTRGNSYGIGKAFKCEPNQTYTMTCKWIKYTALMYIGIGFYDENGNYLSYDATSDESRTFTTPANCKWFTVCFVSGTGGSSYVYNMQLEEGSTPTAFVPNGYIQSYKKSLFCKTKNLFDNIPVKTNYIINSNGEEVASPGFNIYGKTYGNNFTISTNAPVDLTKSDNWLRVCLYNSAGTFIARRDFDFNTRTVANIADDNIAYIQLCFYRASFPNYKLQVELGSTATEYHPYSYL